MAKIENPEKLAEAIIKEFSQNNVFDPFTALTGTESKSQKIYGVCVNFLCELEEAREKITKKFLHDLYKAGSPIGTPDPDPAPATRCYSFEDLDAAEGRCLGPSYL